VPGGAIADALAKVSGLDGKIAIDATNAYGGRNEQYESLAHEVKSMIGGPVAKAFNLEYAVLYDQIDAQRARPSTIYADEDDAGDVAEQRIRDAAYDPVSAGGLERVRTLEDAVGIFSAIRRAGLGTYFHRYAKPGELSPERRHPLSTHPAIPHHNWARARL
jgi:predicted dinucleotide-binding enzyme